MSYVINVYIPVVGSVYHKSQHLIDFKLNLFIINKTFEL